MRKYIAAVIAHPVGNGVRPLIVTTWFAEGQLPTTERLMDNLGEFPCLDGAKGVAKSHHQRHPAIRIYFPRPAWVN